MRRLPLLLLSIAAASLAQPTKPVTASSTLYDVDDANDRAFVEFSRTSTKKLVEAAMKNDPSTRSVSFSVRLFGGTPTPVGRYRIVTIRDGYAELNTQNLAAVSQAATGMSYDDYLKKAASLRRRVGQSLRVRVASTSGDKQLVLAEGDIIGSELMKIAPDRSADYYSLEENDWLPVHRQRVTNGAIKGWSVWSFRSPAGAARPYDAMTTAVYKNLESAMAGQGYPALFAKVHPNKNYAAISDRGRTVRTIVRQDLWRVIWAVSRP